ncbi:iron-containing alcohol dehydrogenase [Paraliomyxa miuraensis]|uniref:iron-containing alcohol dehydrogenase n=1 Tax=Paraliomyxa miuraensis TaxID=376150 RepID=UPI00225593D7|nr:iron-containing alcohol dehydrogenase [Paraliomyxa miuraensis]MCX4244271.1 iron-containing alcohol dehydrogenase [Paraliomyxa miuraensis]
MPTIPTFDETRNGSQISFGRAWSDAMLEHVRRLGLRRVAVICTPGRYELAERAQELLADRGVGVLPIACSHTPREIVDETCSRLDGLGADGLVTIGGGSAISLGKATQLSRSRPFVAIPTTYSGFEMTDTFGIREGNQTIFGREDRVRPTVVVYDPSLTLALPRSITACSLFTALAHAVDALYASTTSARLQAMAASAITRLAVNLPRACDEPDNLEVRANVMRGAYQAGTVHGSASTALHHQLARSVAGDLGLPYPDTHTVLLPHVVAFNASIARRATQALGRALGSRDPSASLFDLALIVDAPTRLDRLGLTAERVRETALKVAAARFDNPRRPTAAQLESLLHDTRLGRRPSVDARRWPALSPYRPPHGSLEAALGGRSLERARRVVVLVHGEGNTAERMLMTGARLFETLEEPAFVAVQAEDRSWFPHRFDAPIRDNEQAITSAHDQLDAVFERLGALGFGRHQVVLCGELQGACIVLDYVARRGGRYAGVIALAGALLGPLRSAFHHEGALRGVPVILGGALDDPWVPRSRVEATAEVLDSLGAEAKVLWYHAPRPELDLDVTNAVREMFGKRPRGDRERERDRDRDRDYRGRDR